MGQSYKISEGAPKIDRKKIKWYLRTYVSATVHIENKKKVRNYDVNHPKFITFLWQVNYHF